MDKELFEKFVRGESTPDEESSVREWYGSSVGPEELEEYAGSLWNRAPNTLSAQQQGRMYHRLMKTVKPSKPEGIESERKPVRKLRAWIPAAVAASFLFGLMLSPFFSRHSSPMSQMSYAVAADKGQRASVTLPDGTRVWLNSDSKIEYKGDFGVSDRRLTLSGEAYFEVAKDPERCFVVSANGLDVEALGTSFNIKAYRDDAFMTATLINGKIKTRFNSQETILEPNQSLSVNRQNKTQSKKETDAEMISLWRKNEIAFDGESFEEIARAMNRMYNIRVEFEDDAVKKFCYVGTIRNNSLDNFLEILSLSTPITYRYSGDTVFVSGKQTME